MSWVKGSVLATSLFVPASLLLATSSLPAQAVPNKAALKAMLEKCSREADAKGLDTKKGKTAERNAFRKDCMKKMGVEPKK